MSRYQVFQYESVRDMQRSWLILDTESHFIARLNGLWLESMTKTDADHMAVLLNWVDSARADSAQRTRSESGGQPT